MGNFPEFYQQGGAFMHCIALTALIGGCVVLERAAVLLFRYDVNARRLWARVQGRMLAGDSAGALRMCTARSSAVARVVHAGLMAGVDRWRAEGAVRETVLEIKPALFRRVTLLSSLASIAMLLGLLGTIFGMIGGFHCAATVSADQRATALAKSISLTINTTGFGLLVAIPLLAAQIWLRALRDRLAADLELFGARVVNLVCTMTDPAPLEPGSPYR